MPYNSNLINFDEYLNNGFFVINNFLNDYLVAQIKDIVVKLEEEEVKINKNYIYSDKVHRVWNLINKNTIFQDVITNETLLKIMDKIFDRKTHHQKFFLSSFQSTCVQPGAIAQALHIDTPVPDPLPLWEIKANSIWLLDDFTELNGATEVIPGSHKFGRRPVNNNIEDHRGLQKIIAPSGSLIIFSGYLWHRAGHNVSNHNRRALLGSFASSAFREISSEEDIVRKSLLNPAFKIKSDCWSLVGGHHGIKLGTD